MIFLEELKRRNVFKVAATYAVLGWLIIEVVDTIAPRMAMPEWVPGFFIVLVMVGFPIAVFLAWAFDLTPDGVVRAQDADGTLVAGGSGPHGVHYVIISALVGLILVQQFAPPLGEINPFAEPTNAEAIPIAVMPFTDFSAAGDQAYLGDGVAEEILNVLANVRGLQVTSRTSAFALKAQNRSIPEIAKILGVSHVVEGSIRKQDDRVRVTAQLIDVANDSHLWSETYDSELTDIFRLQDEIAAQISGALSTELNLTLPEVERDTREWDITAYELYLRARQLILTRNNASDAIPLAEAAIAIELEFADAWASIATAHSLTAFTLGYDPKNWNTAWETYDLAWIAASRAVAIDPGHPLGLAVQGLIRMNQKRWTEAHVFLDRALSVESPDANAYLWMGALQLLTGEPEAALGTLSAGLEAFPRDPNVLRWMGGLMGAQGRWEEAWSMTEIPSALGMADAIVTRSTAGVILGRISREQFLTAVRDAYSADESTVELLFRLTDTDSRTAVTEREAAAVGVRAQYSNDLAPILRNFRPDLIPTFLRAQIPDIVQGPSLMVLGVFWSGSPEEFRQDPEFRQMVRELGLIEYWQLFGWPDVCRAVGADDFACD